MSDGHSAAAAGGHVVIAELEVKPERIGAFIMLAQSFAAECLAREAGCGTQMVQTGESPIL